MQSQQPTDLIQTISIIANCASALGVVVAVIQLWRNNRQHRENARRSAAKEAAELAKAFQKRILSDYAFVSSVLTLTGQRAFFGESKELKRVKLRFTKEEGIVKKHQVVYGTRC